MSKVTAIAVRDPGGTDLTVYEFHDRRFLRKVRRLKLCTGEAVDYADNNAFVVTATGEMLIRR